MEAELINHRIEIEHEAEVPVNHIDMKPPLQEGNSLILRYYGGNTISSQSGTLLEPYEGMEFESEEAAKTFYNVYARHVGFRPRISRYTRSRRDNSIISRRIVCSKEGFRELRANVTPFGEQKQQQREATRVGCKAMIMVKKTDAGKWIVSKFIKEHNHDPVPPRKLENRISCKDYDLAEETSITRGDLAQEPFEGMEFESEEAAKLFYISYARNTGFRARISRYCRSRRDNTIISRQIVCSKEGFREIHVKKKMENEGKIKRPRVITRIGCKAMIVVKKMSGKWVVTRFEKEHNHALVSIKKDPCCTEKISNSQEINMVPNGIISDGYPTGTQGSSQESPTVLYKQLFCEAIKYAQEGATTEHTFKVAMAALKEAAEKVAAAKKSAGIMAAQPDTGVGGTKQAFLVAAGSSVSSLLQIKNFHYQSQDKKILTQELKPQQHPVHFVLLPSGFLADSNLSTCSVEAPLVRNFTSDEVHATQPSKTRCSSNFVTVVNHPYNTKLFTEGLAAKRPEVYDLLEVEKAELHTPDAMPNIVEADQKSQKLETNGLELDSATQSGGKTDMVLSEPKLGGFPALPVTIYMPVVGSLQPTHAGTQGSSFALLATPIEALPVSARPAESDAQPQDTNLGLPSSASKTSTAAFVPTRGSHSDLKQYTGPNPQVHATAIACGARVVSPKAAASLIKAIEGKIRSSGASASKIDISCAFGLSDSELMSPKSCNREGKIQAKDLMNIMSGLEGSSDETIDEGSADVMELEEEAGHSMGGTDEQNQSLFERQMGLLDSIGAADDMTVF